MTSKVKEYQEGTSKVKDQRVYMLIDTLHNKILQLTDTNKKMTKLCNKKLGMKKKANC